MFRQILPYALTYSSIHNMNTKMCASHNCTNAGIELPTGDFYKDSNRRDTLSAYCKRCTDLKNIRYRTQKKNLNPTELRNRERITAARHRYNLTADEAESLWNSTTTCEICNTELNPPCIDHCSETGVTRGLLCRSCNLAIGQFNHDCERLKAAIEYLEKPPKFIRKDKLPRIKVTHCKKGHEFTQENTYTTTDGKRRQCRVCIRERARAYRTAT